MKKGGMGGLNMMSVDEDKWQAEEDLRTLIRAEEVKKDSARMNAVRELAMKKKSELEKLAGGKTGSDKKDMAGFGTPTVKNDMGDMMPDEGMA